MVVSVVGAEPRLSGCHQAVKRAISFDGDVARAQDCAMGRLMRDVPSNPPRSKAGRAGGRFSGGGGAFKEFVEGLCSVTTLTTYALFFLSQPPARTRELDVVVFTAREATRIPTSCPKARKKAADQIHPAQSMWFDAVGLRARVCCTI